MRRYCLAVGLTLSVLSIPTLALPLRWVQGFVENSGQWNVPYRFVYAAPGLTLGVLPNAMVLDAFEQQRLPVEQDRYAVPLSVVHRRGQVVWMEFLGASPAPAVEALTDAVQQLTFFRATPSARVARVFSQVQIRDLYPGITLLLHATPEGPRYDFWLEPNANPQQLRIALRGASSLTLSPDGRELRLWWAAERPIVLHSQLQAYQPVGGHLRPVPVRFAVQKLPDGTPTVHFELGAYDPTLPLVIDPLIFITCVGSGADELAPAVQVLRDGSVLTLLQVEELPFRMTPGAYDTTYNGLTDVVLARFDPTLRRLLFATYLGGSGTELAVGVGVDAEGNLYAIGNTNSPDFPTTVGAFRQQLNGGMDVFVTKLSPTGAALRFSTYIGGNNDDIATTAVVRSDGITVIAGRTRSANYPTTSAAHQRTHAGNWDVFMTGLSNTGASLSFSTFLGGSDNESAWAVAVDPEGYTYLCGETASSNFPNFPVPSFGNPSNRPYDRDYNGGGDAFVAKFAPTSASLRYCTFLGGSAQDYATAIVPRDNGEVWVAGVTRSTNFPITGLTYNNRHSGGQDVFVARFSSSGLGTSALLYSTFLGGSADEEARAILELRNRPVLVGWTRSANFPVTSDAHNRTPLGGQDLFITSFADITATQLEYSTFAGSLRDELPLAAVAADARGNLFIAGQTNSPNLCALSEGVQSGYGGGNSDAFLAKYVFVKLQLIAPRGGERFCAGSQIPFSWQAEGITLAPGDTFRIELSSDGAQWSPIGSTTATVYTWTVPANWVAGRYWARVVHIASGLSDAADSAFTIALPPTITVQPPDSVSLCVGDTLVLSVSAAGDSLSYQWLKDGTPLPGAIAPQLRLPITSLAQAGRYSVRVRGICAPEQTSRATQVLVEERPRILQSPSATTASAGTAVCLTVSVSGGRTRQLQWLKDGVPIPGARDTSYCIPNVTLADSGEYRCVVWNRCGSDTSAPARLSVVSVGELPSPPSVRIHLLPAPDHPQLLRVESSALPARTVLYSLLGQPLRSGRTELALEGIAAGVYVLVVEFPQQRVSFPILLLR
jgi:hypothetical protein